jgi:hypothetical protein
MESRSGCEWNSRFPSRNAGSVPKTVSGMALDVTWSVKRVFSALASRSSLVGQANLKRALSGALTSWGVWMWLKDGSGLDAPDAQVTNGSKHDGVRWIGDALLAPSRGR